MANLNTEDEKEKIIDENLENTISKTKKVMHIISLIIQYIIIFALLAIIVLSIYNRQTSKLEHLISYKFYIIVSGSMQPEINVGDVVVVKKANPVEVGEVIAYQNGANVVVHRVIDKQEVNDQTLYTTKGDFNNVPDINHIRQNQVIGLCKYTIPKIGYISIFATQHPKITIGIFVALILVCILIYVIRKK